MSTPVGLLARTGATVGPFVMMALALAVLGMLMFFGSQGLPDSSFRAFTSHPMFRPLGVGGARVVPAGVSPALDNAAVDALVGMGQPGDDARGPRLGSGTGRGSARRPGSRWFSQRPW